MSCIRKVEAAPGSHSAEDTLLKYRQAQENIRVVAMRHGSQCLKQRGFVSTEDEPRLIPRWKSESTSCVGVEHDR